MAVVVEDGSGKSDSQVYDTVTNCSTWLNLYGKTAFSSLATTALKEQHLLIGTAHVDLRFEPKLPGARIYASLSLRQALAWPRAGAKFAHSGGLIDVNEVPEQWKYATFEAAELSAAGELDTLQPLAGIAEEWSPSGRIKYRAGQQGYPHAEVLRWVLQCTSPPGKFQRA